jgi:hypothetical protein
MWIGRRRLLRLLHMVNSEQRTSMDGFFLPQVPRLLVLTECRVENPPFYPQLRQMGFTILPSFSTMAAVTFCDVVVSHQQFTDGVLFHELVHVEQYRRLGVQRFAELMYGDSSAGAGTMAGEGLGWGRMVLTDSRLEMPSKLNNSHTACRELTHAPRTKLRE